jgi:hypothetical protein
MPQVLTTLATITCPHAGPGTSLPSSNDGMVNGGVVLVEGDTGTLGCLFPVPCTSYTLKSMGLNSTKISSKRVILVTDLNTSITGLPLTMIEHHKVLDDSTVAAIPAGQSAPPITPAMADMTPPVVTATPPAAVFNTTTQMPATIPITFTLATAFPMQWSLVWISVPDAKSKDLTNGMPGAMPAPPGGSWPSGALTVVLNLSLPFLSTLSPGLHYFYMTGASQRGLTGIAQCILTVS